jgi:methanogenic corrinoid protein MtbC1
LLNRCGYKISSIANLDNEELSKKIISISNKSLDADRHIEGMIITLLELNEMKFEKLLNSLILNLGFENTMIKVLSPFFEKIGILWQIGTIKVAHEHFITNLIRQKMMVAIDGLVRPANITNQKTFILYLPETELHEIALLFYSYLIQKRGHKVIYLGQMVPLEDLPLIAEIHPPDILLSIFTTSYKNNDIESHLNKLSALFPTKKIFVGGLQFKIHDFNLPSNVSLIKSSDSLNYELDLLH